MTDVDNKFELALFPLRNSVLFPFALTPYSAGRPISVQAIDVALQAESKELAVFTQRQADIDLPNPSDLFTIGTRALIKRMNRSDDTVEILVQGIERVRLLDTRQVDEHFIGTIERLPMPLWDSSPSVEAIQRELISLVKQYQTASQSNVSLDIEQAMQQIRDPVQLVYFMAMIPNLGVERSQQILEANSVLEIMNILHDYYTHELEVLKLRKEIAGQVQSEMSRQQREHLLRQQMRTIQQELGEGDNSAAEIDDLRQRIDEANLPDNVREEAERELTRLQRMNNAAPDYQMVRNYLDLLLDLPWEVSTEDQLDLNHASEVLDEDHYGLDKIKERILEQLAVLKLNPEAKAPILLFVGPPGVGKTSLGKSIARALGRKFERFSLGGMHDESELRGHRRTYIGAMPGRIIQAMRRAEANNPVLMLDEVDKLGRDYRGDPASALLEVLDPNQNTEFYDNYVGLPFDLSKTFFILTANALDTIPTPLLDRMEIIQLTGYSEEEKLEIAKRYLVERQRKEVGLTEAQFQLPDDTLKTLISRYTREAGVRNLERIIGRVARKIALKIARDPHVQIEPVTPNQLEGLLGPEKFLPEQARKHMPAGVAAGMAWTPVGGDILYIEAIRLPKGEGLHLTGQLGEVMKESAQTAHAWVQAQLQNMGIEDTAGRIHIHVPAGAVPKDGPSAGVTMATAMMSLYTKLPVRQDTAMTGEITLTGLVLPVGGIKEKVLAAHRAGLRQIILPKQNERDLADLPAEVRADLKVVLASDVSDVLRAAIPDLPALT